MSAEMYWSGQELCRPRKEANRIEAARVLGKVAVGGNVRRNGHPHPYLGIATKVARRLGVSRRTVFKGLWRLHKQLWLSEDSQPSSGPPLGRLRSRA